MFRKYCVSYLKSLSFKVSACCAMFDSCLNKDDWKIFMHKHQEVQCISKHWKMQKATMAVDYVRLLRSIDLLRNLSFTVVACIKLGQKWLYIYPKPGSYRTNKMKNLTMLVTAQNKKIVFRYKTLNMPLERRNQVIYFLINKLRWSSG